MQIFYPSKNPDLSRVWKKHENIHKKLWDWFWRKRMSVPGVWFGVITAFSELVCVGAQEFQLKLEMMQLMYILYYGLQTTEYKTRIIAA